MIRRGRVVRMFDDEKVAINLGSEDGIKRGQRIYIYAPEVSVEDPETGDTLGDYRHLKSTARAVTVSQRFTIVGPYPRQERVTDPLWSGLIPGSRTRTRRGELPVDEGQLEPLPTGNDIRIGDQVEAEVDDPADQAVSDGSSTAPLKEG